MSDDTDLWGGRVLRGSSTQREGLLRILEGPGSLIGLADEMRQTVEAQERRDALYNALLWEWAAGRLIETMPYRYMQPDDSIMYLSMRDVAQAEVRRLLVGNV